MNSAMVCSFSRRHRDGRCATMSLVQRSPAGHDRATGATDRAPKTPVDASVPDPFDAALERLRLEGAIFLRAEYRVPWAYESMTGADTAAILRPGTDLFILFHVVSSGTCWVQVEGQEKHWAGAGDVIVLPYGDQHRMGGVEDGIPVSIGTFLPAPPWLSMPVLRHGVDGAQTDVVCGYLLGNDPLFDPELRAFPPVFVVRPQAGPVADWVR